MDVCGALTLPVARVGAADSDHEIVRRARRHGVGRQGKRELRETRMQCAGELRICCSQVNKARGCRSTVVQGLEG